MKLEVFEALIKTIEEQVDTSVELAKMGVDLLSYDDGWVLALSLAINAYYGQRGGEWIRWYLFEKSLYDPELKALDEKGKEICYDIPSLWKHVEELRVSDSFEEYSLPSDEKITERDLLSLFPKRTND